MAARLHSEALQWGMLLVLLFSFAGWAMSMSGLAVATDKCRKQELRDFPDVVPRTMHLQAFTQVPGDVNWTFDCGTHFSLDWWIVVFQLAVIAYATVGVFKKGTFSKHAILGFTAISTVLYTFLTSVYIKLGYQFNRGSYTSNVAGQSCKLLAAGGITTVVSNYVFLFMFSSEEDATPSQ